MHVYFVRHGETALNRAHRHQSPSTPLSSQGYEQAATAAEYLRHMNPDLLLSSSYTRAMETARIIGSRLELEPLVHAHFHEIVRPTRLCGKSLFHPETYWYVMSSFFKRHNSSWRYYDAENFYDIVTRARAALTYLESLADSHQSVVVVSHTVFINIMVAYLCHNRMLSVWDMFPTIFHIKETENAGVVGVRYLGKSDSKNVCRWELIHRA